MLKIYKKKSVFTLLLALLGWVVAENANAQTPCGDLYFSEYLEGASGNNKAYEIYNPTANAITLDNYSVKLYVNGAATTTTSFTFPTGTTIAAGGVVVVAHTSQTYFTSTTGFFLTTTTTTFNGDDALVLFNGTTILDIIGNIGCDPGAEWITGTKSTKDRVIRRKATVNKGVSIDPADTPCDFPTLDSEWNDFVDTDVSGFGSHTQNPCGAAPVTNCGDLFISEYIEGSSSNKALEIYNPTNQAIDLSNYRLEMFGNGSTTGSNNLVMRGMLASGDVYVVGNASADPAITAIADTLHSITFYNGDDAIALIKGTDTLDIIGVIGVDPGTNWPVGSGATSEFTLVRMASVQKGQKNWTIGATEWNVNPQNTFTFLGSHTSSCIVAPNPVVSFAASTSSVMENVGTTTITLSIASPSATDTVAVKVRVASTSTATRGTDYTFTDTVVVWQANDAADKTITLTIIDDAVVENNETIELMLADATNAATIGAVGTHTLTIQDNDTGGPVTNCGELFISEYIEGSSNNKAIEIYNPTNQAINMANYRLELFGNGATTGSNPLVMRGMLASGDVYVVANPSADPAILALADTTHSITFYNGDDAFALFKGNDTLDIFGKIGERAYWKIGADSTAESTWVRKSTVQKGQKDWSQRANEWNTNPQNTFSFLGAHTSSCISAPVAPVVAFSAASASVGEAAGTATVTLNLANPSSTDTVAVRVRIGSTGTATRGTDYTFTDSVVVWQANDAAPKVITVSIIDDTAIEGDETIVMNLANPTNGAILGAATFTLTITDNDFPTAVDCAEPFISEYLEGSSNNKALEIYNPTSQPIDLSNYRLELFSNGATSGSNPITMRGMLASGEVYVVANSNADPAILAVADTTHTITFFNGDDAIGLFKGTTMIDVIGEIGVRPTPNWPVGTGATSEFTLVRKNTIKKGQLNWTIGATEWNVNPQNTFSFLNSHTSDCITIGVKESLNAKTVAVYPNPVTDMLTVNFGDNSVTNAQVVIFNTLGQQVKSDVITGNEATLNVSSLATGMYMIQISTENKVTVKQFIKAN